MLSCSVQSCLSTASKPMSSCSGPEERGVALKLYVVLEPGVILRQIAHVATKHKMNGLRRALFCTQPRRLRGTPVCMARMPYDCLGEHVMALMLGNQGLAPVHGVGQQNTGHTMHGAGPARLCADPTELHFSPRDYSRHKRMKDAHAEALRRG